MASRISNTPLSTRVLNLAARVEQEAPTRVSSASKADLQRRESLKAALYQALPPARIAALLSSNATLARGEVAGMLRRLAIAGPTRIAAPLEREQVIADLVSEVLGLGAIDELLADPSVTEVMVNGPDRIFFERRGKLLLSPARYTSAEQLRTVIDRIISPLGRRIDEQNPMVNGRLPEGHRVHAIIAPLALDGPILTIRKFNQRVFSLDELSSAESLPQELAQLLRWAVLARQNIAVSGGTGSGKTTLLNALSLELPPDERIITIEDSAELKFAAHPHVVRLEARPPNLEGKGQVSIRDLVINSLRMRPDRIIVGEVRGAEALEMLQAMNTGHDGSLTTLHANSPAEVITRLVTMVGYGVDLPLRQIETQIAAALDLIVHLDRCADGSRRITQVVELCQSASTEDCPFSLRPFYRFEQTATADDGRVLGRSQFCAEPSFVKQLATQALAQEEEVAKWRLAATTL
jgi:pilus assembly protein CpaF